MSNPISKTGTMILLIVQPLFIYAVYCMAKKIAAKEKGIAIRAAYEEAQKRVEEAEERVKIALEMAEKADMRAKKAEEKVKEAYRMVSLADKRANESRKSAKKAHHIYNASVVAKDAVTNAFIADDEAWANNWPPFVYYGK